MPRLTISLVDSPSIRCPAKWIVPALIGRSPVTAHRAEDFPAGGWDIHKRWYGVPDLLFQAYSMPTAIHPESEQRVVDATLALIEGLR